MKAAPLRIVYVSWEHPPQIGGGIGTYVHAISRILAVRGHEITVITQTSEPFPLREFRDGVMILRLPGVEPRGGGPLEVLQNRQQRAAAVAVALRMLVRGGVDLIEFPDYRGEGIAYLSETRPGERPVCVLRLHAPLAVVNAYNPDRLRHELLEQFELQAVPSADRIVSPSRVLARELHSRLGEFAVDYLPYPADPTFLDAGGDAVDANESDDVLYFGRAEQIKGSETLAHAARRFFEACPRARLVMLGGDTEKSPRQLSMRAILREIVGAAHRDRLVFLDPAPRDELIRRIRAARLCVLPSHFDNFPNTCLEAMALGKLVIAGGNTGMAEMIETGVSGVVVPSANVDALAEAMIRSFEMTAAERAAIGAAAQRRVRQRYAPDVIASELEALYGGYLGEKPAAPLQAMRVGEASDRPRVAVVIPCFNHGAYLQEALASVRAQSCPVVDCIVVDDGSTDAATLAVLDEVRRAGVRVIRQENQGLAAARNTGIRASDAPFFVPLDADDALEPTFIEQLIAPLVEDPALGYAYSHIRFFGAMGGELAFPAYDPGRLLYQNLSVATAVVRRRAYDEAGGYRSDMTYGFEDWDLWLGLLSGGWRGVCVPQPLFHYRKHAGGSMLSRLEQHREEMIRVMIGHHPRLFGASSDGAGDTPAMPLDPILARLAAEAELNHIENSRFWRLMRRLRLARSPDAVGDADVAQRLALVKSSAAYRMIQALKRTTLYRGYARARYGPDFRSGA